MSKLFFLLLSLSVRGELRLGRVLLLTAVFMGFIVSLESMAYSYSLEIEGLRSFAVAPKLSVSVNPRINSTRVRVSYLTTSKGSFLILAPDNLKDYLEIYGVKLQANLSAGEVLLGSSFRSIFSSDEILLGSETVRAVGFLEKKPLKWAIILTPETFDKLGLEGYTLYYSKGGGGFVEAPSTSSLIKSISNSILSSLRLLSFFLYAMLALSSAIQGYLAARGAESVFKVLSILGCGYKRTIAGIVSLSILFGAVGTFLGFSLGLTVPAMSSTLASLFLKFPYVKPAIEWEIAKSILVGLLSSSLSLSIGLIRGFQDVVSG